jgi:hypothetical protein
MKISDLFEGSEFQTRLEELAYKLLLKIREAKKNNTLSRSKNKFESILAEVEKLVIMAHLMEDEIIHINNWINSPKKALGIKE